MPDHVHLFAARVTEEVPFDNWVRFWKSQFSKRHAEPSHKWQTDHWDTRMRSLASYEEKWEYVRANPVRHGLVASVIDWPFQGDLCGWTW